MLGQDSGLFMVGSRFCMLCSDSMLMHLQFQRFFDFAILAVPCTCCRPSTLTPCALHGYDGLKLVYDYFMTT